jgi:tetratricopeptide (TPR) repeat protein
MQVGCGDWMGEQEVRIFGRDKELTLLDAAYKETIGGAARFVLVEGEGGIGKGQLIKAFVSRTVEEGTAVLQSECLGPYDIDPYIIFKDLVGKIESDEEEDDALGFIYEPVDIQCGSLALLALDSAQGKGAGREHYSPQLDTDLVASGKNKMFDRVVGILQRQEASGPITIIINNIHWLSPASVSLLQYMMQSMRDKRILIIGTSRHEEGGGTESDFAIKQLFGTLRDSGIAKRILLGPISRSAVGDMIRSYLALKNVSEEALDTLFNTTGGHPLFLHETLNAIKRDPKLWEDVQNPRKDALFHLTVSTDVSHAVSKKLEYLGEDEKKLLYSAAVIENEFEFEMLLKMAEMKEERFIDALDRLIEIGVLVEMPREEEMYRFKRRIIKDVVYSEISKARRRLLHKRAAIVMEEMGSSNPYLLAVHFYKGKLYDKALDHGIAAGDQASSIYAHNVANRYYDIALDCMEALTQLNLAEKKMEILLKKGRNYSFLGMWDESIESSMHAMAIAEVLDYTEVISGLYGDLGSAYMRKSRWEDSIESFDSLLKIATDNQNVIEMANANFGKAMVHYKKGDYPVAIEGYKEVIEMISDLSPEINMLHLSRFTRMLGAAHYRMGELDKAEECFQKSYDISKERDDGYEMGVTMHRLGMVANRLGKYDEAISYYTMALAKFEEIGDMFQMSKNYINLGESYFNLGDKEKALENYKKAETFDRRTENVYGVAISLGLQGELHTSMGNYDEAKTLLLENAAICEGVGNRYGLAMAKKDLAVVLFVMGDKEKSLEHLEDSVNLFSQIKSQKKGEAEVLLALVVMGSDPERGKEMLAPFEESPLLDKAKNKLCLDS